MKKKLIIIATLIILGVPIIISELYKLNKGYMTPWGAEDTLSYASTIISAVATFVLGWIAIAQNKKANEISDRLLRLEEVYSVPSICVVEDECEFVEYSENSVHIKITIKNLSNGILKIKQVSDMNMIVLQTDREGTLQFAKQCLEYTDLLPSQKKQLDFFINLLGRDSTLCDKDLIRKLKCRLHISGKFSVVLGYKDSEKLYREEIKFAGLGVFQISTIVSLQQNEISRSDYKVEMIEI